MSQAPLTADDLLAANILPLRPGRARDTARESAALDLLIGRINAAPDHALQALAETVADLCRAGSAGVSLLIDGSFVWPAIAGAWAPYIDKGLPQDASPCGVVIERNLALLFDEPRQMFPNIDVEPSIREILLVPLLFDGAPEGTLWAISHDDHRFDAEDVRILDRLAPIAMAIENARRLRAQTRQALKSAQDRVRNTIAVIRSLLRDAAARPGESERDVLVTLSSRINAFAEGAAGRGADGSLDLWTLLTFLLERHGERLGERVTANGPPVRLAPEQGGPLALAIHELLENAYDHGALGRTGGRIAVEWSVERDGAQEVLDLRWEESGGLSPVLATPLRGFGLELLEDGLPTLIGATTRIEIKPSRFTFSLRLPLAAELLGAP